MFSGKWGMYNGPRPKLSVGSAAGLPGCRQSFHYTGAIKKYGHLLEDHLLEKAYDEHRCFLQVSVFSFNAFVY